MRLKCIKDYKSTADWGFNKKTKRGIKIGSFYKITNEDSLGYRVIDELGRN